MSDMDVEQLTEWLWCLRTPIVQAYAVRERDGFNLIDACPAGEDGAILTTLREPLARARPTSRVSAATAGPRRTRWRAGSPVRAAAPALAQPRTPPG